MYPHTPKKATGIRYPDVYLKNGWRGSDKYHWVFFILQGPAPGTLQGPTGTGTGT
jgi:hypothetical protein